MKFVPQCSTAHFKGYRAKCYLDFRKSKLRCPVERVQEGTTLWPKSVMLLRLYIWDWVCCKWHLESILSESTSAFLLERYWTKSSVLWGISVKIQISHPKTGGSIFSWKMNYLTSPQWPWSTLRNTLNQPSRRSPTLVLTFSTLRLLPHQQRDVQSVEVQASSAMASTHNGLDSPCSSRASVAGSCVSDVWSTASTAAATDVTDMDSGIQANQPPQSNMVLRKRIRRIRQGMKRYNDQLVEVKKELKVCKSKMETQTKQVTEYSQRLEDYDKKFEESSRKFQTLLTELNKCKTELQYWRSKSTTLLALPSTCASCSAPLLPSQSAEDAEAELKALANQGIFLTDESIEVLTDNDGQVQKQNFEEAATTSASAIAGPASPNLRSSTCKSGPPSPLSASGGRKRKSRDDLSLDDEALVAVEGDLKRKNSLRGSAASAGIKNTRFKRPKTASTN